MIGNTLKIAVRNLWKFRVFNLFNIVGLAMGFAGFILSYDYINREKSYDAWNPDYEEIYLVGLTYQGQNTDQTPPSFARRIKSRVPEVVETGRLYHYRWGKIPFFGDEVVTVENAKIIDKGMARMMKVAPRHFALDDTTFRTGVNLVSERVASRLFRESGGITEAPRSVPWMSTALGVFETIHDVGQPRGPSLLDYEFLIIDDLNKRISDEQEGNPVLYQTFIQVVPGTDPATVRRKINDVFREEVSGYQHVVSSAFADGEVYLDPLVNLHLRPKHGSASGYLTVWILGILSVVILVLAAVNFANMMIAQSQNRAKEIGVRKILGAGRMRLACLFFLEILMLCVMGAAIAWWSVFLYQYGLQKSPDNLWNEHLGNRSVLVQLAMAVLGTSLVAGLYPAWLMSGFRPASVLKGILPVSRDVSWLRNGFLAFQFLIAVVFLIGMLVVSIQLNHMRRSDKGFEPSQVITIANWGLYENAHTIDQLRRRLKQHSEIEYLTTTTDVPGMAVPPPSVNFEYAGASKEADHVSVDVDYFETLAIRSISGRTFTVFMGGDSSHTAVINQRAAEVFGMEDPVGKKIRACEVDFTIVGVVENVMMQGFEQAVRPIVYSTGNECGGTMRPRQAVMVRTSPGNTGAALELLQQEWKKNTAAEGIPFSYEFLDQQYAALHADQERLRNAQGGFAILSVVIAMMGLFSMSAYTIRLRQREMSIRKVLGASVPQLFVHLNRPFFRSFLLAHLAAVPIGYILAKHWLAIFAYKIELSWWMFIVPGFLAALIGLVTVVYQSWRAAVVNPVESLRKE